MSCLFKRVDSKKNQEHLLVVPDRYKNLDKIDVCLQWFKVLFQLLELENLPQSEHAFSFLCKKSDSFLFLLEIHC